MSQLPAEAAVAAINVSGAASRETEENRRSRKPANTRFKQQQLAAWQPMLTARSVLPFLVAIGVAFIPIGIALFLSASNVMEFPIDYTDCQQYTDYSGGTYEDQSCANVTAAARHAGKSSDCKCRILLSIDRNVSGPVYIYYGLDNFFQNHRKYVKSRDDTQLMGSFENDLGKSAPSPDCAPFAMANATFGYAPCGAVANSLFNDSIGLTYLGSGLLPAEDVGLLRTGIAWRSDKEIKFRNPNGNSAIQIENACKDKKLIKPAYWSKQLWELDPQDDTNNGLKNEDLIVWMRTAAFPNFRKLYRRVDHVNGSRTFADGLPPGNYSINIDYKFPVTEFEGRKYVIISSVSWIGGRNPFLGIAYMTVGCVCLLLSAVFFFIHVKWGKNYESESLAGLLNADTPFARRVLRSVFQLDTPHFTSPDTSFRSPGSSGRWMDTIPDSSETDGGSSSPSHSNGRTLTRTETPNDSSFEKRSVHFELDSSRGPPSPTGTENSVHVKVVSSLGGLRTWQTIHELLNDILANVTVVDASQREDLANLRSSPRKSLLRPATSSEDPNDPEVRMRRRQMMDQPVLVD